MPRKSVETHTPQSLRHIVSRVARCNARLEGTIKAMSDAGVDEIDIQCHNEMVRALHKLELFAHEADRSLHVYLEEQGYFSGPGSNPSDGARPSVSKTKPKRPVRKRAG